MTTRQVKKNVKDRRKVKSIKDDDTVVLMIKKDVIN